MLFNPATWNEGMIPSAIQSSQSLNANLNFAITLPLPVTSSGISMLRGIASSVFAVTWSIPEGEKFKKLPGIALSPAAKNNRIYRIEEHDLVYFGPRSGENIIKLMNLIHPAADASTK